jgi:hypothetical protein
MAIEPKNEEPDIAPKRPDIQPDPRPEKVPLDKDGPQKEPPPMQVQAARGDVSRDHAIVR